MGCISEIEASLVYVKFQASKNYIVKPHLKKKEREKAWEIRRDTNLS